IVLFIIDSGCSKHMTGNLKLLTNFVDKFLGTMKFGNDQISPILGYGDLVQGAVTIKRFYYIEGLNHNLFYVGQFCDADLEVAFWKSTCYIRDLKENGLLTGSRGTYLYSITLQDTSSPNPICLMAKATSSQEWLWHRCLSHLNFDTINLLSKNDIVIGLLKLKFVKDHLCSSCELRKAKRKKYVPVIIDDYSRYTWTHFLRSKDETPEVLIDFLRLVQIGLHAQVRIIRTDKGTKFLNKTLHAYFPAEGILHQTFVARTTEQNGVVERQNRTLVEATRTMLSAAKVPLFFWAEAIATACFTQNRSLVIPRHEKTLYHIINDRKMSVKFFHIFGSLCYIVGDGENLDKMKEKVDACIFVGYSTQSRAYRIDVTDLNILVVTDLERLRRTDLVTYSKNQSNSLVETNRVSCFGNQSKTLSGKRSRIDNDIYSIVDACPNACEMWKAIKRLKHDESINVQDLEINLYWEFGTFTSRDGESLKSYYSRFDKMMNELVRNQCDVTNHQLNVQFLIQLQPKWKRFVTLVKQGPELKTVSYHKLYDILKKHQNEVNEIRAERITRTGNPLALVAQQQPVYHPQNHPTHYTQNSSTSSQQAATRNRGKAIVNSPPPIYDHEPSMVAEDDEMSKDKANQDNSPRINRGVGYDNQILGNVTGARETVAYHGENMLLCKQEEAIIQLNAEQADWKDDTDDESED
nr:hypothetical protein [Tanacetum cinerariifolium]